MAILKIARMGHPVLRHSALPVPDATLPELRQLIGDMNDTMHDAPGVGLAAPQVLVGVRLIVYRAPADRIGEDDAVVPDTVLINPEIAPLTDRMVLGWEGCLSVPGFRGLVPRYTHISYRGVGSDGRRIEGEATGFLARVIQHEFDHLDGILYIDRMHDLRLLVHEEEAENFRLADYVDAGGQA
jgi:peptide deformylase